VKKFEYDCFRVNEGIPLLQALNALGQEGWECFFMDAQESLMFCKREMSGLVMPDKPHTPLRSV
jgi:hypothetical protein